VFVPLLLLTSATFAAAVVAYGTHPGWAQLGFGMGIIVVSRHLQWPLVAVSIVLCLVLIGLVVSGRRRAWWLIGLGPVLALFVHRFHTDPLRGYAIIEEPTFAGAGEVGFLEDADYVVGLTFNNVAYAYPYVALYRAPVVFQSDHDQRMMLVWSAFANRAVAFHVTRELRARDVEIVSFPADALLLYHRRYGQFINGVTGRRHNGKAIDGVVSAIETRKVTWKDWRANHPETRVLTLPGVELKDQLPNRPLLPFFPKPRIEGELEANAWITMVGVEEPVALQTAERGVFEAYVDGAPAVIFRDPATGRVRAFDRRVNDLSPGFMLYQDPKRRERVLVDTDTETRWSLAGVALEGPLAKTPKKLSPLPVDELLFYGVMKVWYPKLEVVGVGE
jgi:hypothetical protein